MLIAIDYDKTYSSDPELWNAFIISARERGHTPCVVTMRHDTEMERIPHEIGTFLGYLDVFYTGRQGKKKFMENLGLRVDIWIDDTPQFILEDAWTGD
jgi:hypothetical protein